MQRTVSLKLVDAPPDECLATAEAFRDACRTVSTRIEDGHRINTLALQKTTYRDLSALPSQMRISACRVVGGLVPVQVLRVRKPRRRRGGNEHCAQGRYRHAWCWPGLRQRARRAGL